MPATPVVPLAAPGRERSQARRAKPREPWRGPAAKARAPGYLLAEPAGLRGRQPVRRVAEQGVVVARHRQPVAAQLLGELARLGMAQPVQEALRVAEVDPQPPIVPHAGAPSRIVANVPPNTRSDTPVAS